MVKTEIREVRRGNYVGLRNEPALLLGLIWRTESTLELSGPPWP